jgi:hypothetical protein
MKGKQRMNKLVLIVSAIFISSCATIVNDPNVPVSLSFADGSSGNCKLSNKRGNWSADLPVVVMIRRSDDPLRYDCETESGKKAFGSIPSDMEGGKLAASVFFFDLGITDSITDKHRTYPATYVVPAK